MDQMDGHGTQKRFSYCIFNLCKIFSSTVHSTWPMFSKIELGYILTQIVLFTGSCCCWWYWLQWKRRYKFPFHRVCFECFCYNFCAWACSKFLYELQLERFYVVGSPFLVGWWELLVERPVLIKMEVLWM